MTEINTANSPTPKHLNTTRVLFYIIFAAIALQALCLIVNAFYFAMTPAASIQFKNTGAGYNGQGLTGYFNYSFKALSFNAEVTNPKLFSVSSCILSFVTYSLPMLIIMNYARKLLKTLAHSYTAFTVETADFIRKIGKWIILMAIFRKFIFQTCMNLINFHEFNFENPVDLSYLLAGIFALLLADIFEKGLLLQQESDMTL